MPNSDNAVDPISQTIKSNQKAPQNQASYIEMNNCQSITIVLSV